MTKTPRGHTTNKTNKLLLDRTTHGVSGPIPGHGQCNRPATTTGIRHARYLDIDKTRLEHDVAAAAINLIRLDGYLTGRPLDRGRTSHLARLDFTLAA